MIRFADLYSGGGLGATGAAMAGACPVLAIDAWDTAAKTYQTNFPGCKVLTDKVQDVAPEDHLREGDIDLLISSPECTSHSIARGALPPDRGSKETAMHSLRWVEALKPRWVLMENVARIRSWSKYSDLIEGLTSLGYVVREEVLDAQHFGVPQRRRRLFVCAAMGEEPGQLIRRPTRRRVVRDVIHPDRWPMTPLYTDKRAESTLFKAENAIKTLGSRSEFLIVYYGSDKAGGWQGLDEPLRTLTTLDRFGYVCWKNGQHHIRMMQLPEISRAMGLPTGFKFPEGTRRDKIKICGNGVCPPVIRRVISSMIPASLRLRSRT